jgi:hypothetical protein
MKGSDIGLQVSFSDRRGLHELTADFPSPVLARRLQSLAARSRARCPSAERQEHMSTFHRLLIALFLKKMSVAKLIAFSRDVQDGFGKETVNLPNPDPPLGQVKSDTDGLEGIQAKYKHDTSLKTERDAARATVEGDVERLGQYAVTRARLLPPEQGAAVLANAGFSPRKAPTLARELFKIRDGRTSGTVIATIFRKLIAKRHEQVEVFIQFSADGGKTWQDGPSSFKVNVPVSGLTSGTVHWFRFRVKVGDTLLDWEPGIPHLVK